MGAIFYSPLRGYAEKANLLVGKCHSKKSGIRRTANNLQLCRMHTCAELAKGCENVRDWETGQLYSISMAVLARSEWHPRERPKTVTVTRWFYCSKLCMFNQIYQTRANSQIRHVGTTMIDSMCTMWDCRSQANLVTIPSDSLEPLKLFKCRLVSYCSINL